MISKHPPQSATYTVAVLLVALAIALSFLYIHLLNQTVFAFFYLAVCISTWYGGRYPGLTTIALSTLAINYFWLPPSYTWHLSSQSLTQLAIYVAVMLLIHWFTAELIDTREQIASRSKVCIQQSEIQLHQALQAAKMGVWEHNLKMNQLIWSPEHEALFGLAPGTFDGRYETFAAFLHPDDRQNVQRNWTENLAHKGCLVDEFRIVWADGSIHWLEVRGQVICDRHGEPVQLSGTVMNIDERIQAEQQLQQLNQELETRVEERTAALKASKARYRAIVEEQTELITHFRSDGTILYVNDAYCRYFDLRRADLIGRSYAPVIFAADLEAVNQQVQSLNVENPIITITNRVVVKGEVRWTQWINRLLSNQPDEFVEIQAVGRDITHLKQTEEALRLSKNRLKLALEASGDGLWEWNVVTGEVYLDTNWLAMLGYAEGELPMHYSVWEQLIHPDDRPWVVDTLKLHLQDDNYPYRFDYRIRTKSNDWKWIANYGKVVACADDGTPLRMVGIHQDISDRKQSEEQLRHLSVRLTLALKAGAIGTWDWDTIHEAYWDNQMYELYGLQHLGRPACHEDWIQELHPDDREHAETALKEALEGKQDFDTEFRIIHPDGSLHYIKAAAVVQRDAAGNPQRMVGINYDITQRKRYEQALAEHNHEIEDLYNNAPCGYHSLDSEGRYLRVNETELKLLGYSREEMIGQPLLNFFTADSRQAFLTNYQVFQRQGWVKNLEYDMICKDGTILPVMISATAITDADGKFVGTRATLIDVRDRKQAEEQLRLSAERTSLANAELSRAARLKDEFLAGMSHELRTPLNAVLGMSEVLLEELQGPLTNGQRDAIKLIERSGQHLLTLINDILDLAKVESGKMDLEITPVAIRRLCDTSLSFVKQQAYQKHIHLHCDAAKDLPAVELDERRMGQVLINLLSNAVKFTPEGGRVKLSVHLTPTSAELAIADTGIGIPLQQMDKLFQPFVQLDSSLSRRYAGTGLGLALVQRIVNLHGGVVTVSSEVGKGSCFTVKLPRQRSQPLQAVSPIPAAMPCDEPIQAIAPIPPLAAPMVVVAEDNEANIEVILNYLQAYGLRTAIARNGREAIQLVQHYHPDLVLMDIQMPEMDGLEATRQLRAHADLNTIPIIALTALAMPGDRERCLNAGANDYLIKPIGLKQLLKVITPYLPEHTLLRL